jgi:hypothetical protein
VSVGDADTAADGAGPDTRDTPAGDHDDDDDDLSIVTRQLGRPPAGPFEVVVRSSDGQPAVIANAPFLADGTPMPTRYWLTDPDLRDAVSRLESEGGVRAADVALPPTAIAEAHARYAAARDALIASGHEGPRPRGGVGGTRQGVKCLHAHLAWWLAGGDDPVGQWTADRLGLTRPVATG